MFDIAWSKLMIIGVVALIVIGPKDLPGVLRSLGEMVGKLRRMADEFRGQFNEAMRETPFEDIKRDMSDLGESVRSATSTGFNPIQTIRDEVKGAVEARNAGQAAPPAGQAATAVANVAEAEARLAEARRAEAEARALDALTSIPAPELPATIGGSDIAPPESAPAPKKRKVAAKTKAKATPETDAS
jgi:sec-independent protein translocase protein TatB